MNRTRQNGPNGATNENRFAKPDVTIENRKSQNNPILLQQLLNNGISLQNYCQLIKKLTYKEVQIEQINEVKQLSRLWSKLQPLSSFLAKYAEIT